MINRLPPWFKQGLPGAECLRTLDIISRLGLHTVCREAKCPNLAKCLGERKLTFMILGDACTRNCRFCGVSKNGPRQPDIDHEEPGRVSRAVGGLGLKYVVITSVTRDDLVDGGAAQFSRCVESIRALSGFIKVEVLVPDFSGSSLSIKQVAGSGPYVFAHNLETVERLYPVLKPRSNYRVSLSVLKQAKEASPQLITKSSLMLGLGEKDEEVAGVMRDLIGVGCDLLTLGQYLAPSGLHFPVKEFISLEKFRDYEKIGTRLGFKKVLAGPLVRSSYEAEYLSASL